MKKLESIKKLESGNEVIISALGDSLTAGWMVNKGYLDYLEEMLIKKYQSAKIKIINCGIPGDTADGGLSRIRFCSGDKNPDIYIVEFGLNDAFIGHSVSRFKNNIKFIVNTIRDIYNSEIILITSVPVSNKEENEIINRYYKSIEEVSIEENTFFAEPHKLFTEKINSGARRSGLYLSDMVHPSSEGYKLIAESIMGLF
jgi:acyl-CoA thioesterase-1